MTPIQQIPCPACEGYKRVAILTAGHPMFQQMINKPMAVTYSKAKELLEGFRGNSLQNILMRGVSKNLDTTPCPHCNATGIAFTLTFGEPNTSFEKVP